MIEDTSKQPLTWRVTLSAHLPALLLVWAPCALIVLRSSAPAISVWFWCSLVALPAGALVRREVGWGLALLPATWIVASLGTSWLAPSLFSRSWAAAAACSALYALGFSLRTVFGAGKLLRGPSWSAAGLLWLLSGLLCALPSGAGRLAHPWPPATTAKLLDLSPQVWVFESAGFDWLRHPAVYERAGAADLGPDMRVPWRAPSAYLALGAALLLTLTVGRSRRIPE